MHNDESRGRQGSERIRRVAAQLRYASIDCVLHGARFVVSMLRSPRVLAVLSLVVLAGVAGTFVYISLFESGSFAPRQYSSVYAFVPDTLSKSAPIVITLPHGITAHDAQAHITFDPAIEGVWVKQEAQTLIYKPKEALIPERYYAVVLDAPTVQLVADFKAVDDPILEAVFPAEGAEANEYSAITLVFNRPMVPLSVLAAMKEEPLPITITPSTDGTFTWKSTRTLQFVPNERLWRASHYTVTLGEGMASIEGVPVLPNTFTFSTRPLRVEHMSEGDTRYNQPEIIRFNQPVDLEATKQYISVFRSDGSDQREVPFEVEYGVRRIYNEQTREYDEIEDISQLWIYQTKDDNGRARLWDFAQRYTIRIRDAVPLEGTLRERVERQSVINVLDGILSVSARSDRSEQVDATLFDPEGELLVTFVEEIDLARSTIRAQGLTDMRYETACVRNEADKIVYDAPGECRTEEVLDTIVLRFDPTALRKGETIPISFERIMNRERSPINARPMTRTITTYPELALEVTNPTEGMTSASLTELTLCTNSPLKTHSSESYHEALSANQYLVFSRWNQSYRVSSTNEFCPIGTYRTTIQYGLHPEESYTLALSLEDQFGQTISHTRSFVTEAPKEQYVRFHNLQKVYNVTPPDRTRLTYAAENLEYVDMVLCKVSARTFLDHMMDAAQTSMPLAPGLCEQYLTDRIELPKRYWVNNYFQISLADYVSDTKGYYLISFTHPLMVRDQWNRATRKQETARYYDRTYVSVTDLSVAEKRIAISSAPAQYDKDESARPAITDNPALQSLLDARRDMYWVTRIGSLAAVPGATVTTYTRARDSSTLTPSGSALTGADGVAQIASGARSAAAIVEAGADSAVVAEWSDQLQYADLSYQHEHTYIYTDRPIYRPGHTVHIKGIDRIGYDGGHIVVDGLPATAKVFSSRNEKIAERAVTLNAYGTFAFDLTLPEDAPLGGYRIEVLGQYGYFDVEEYVPSAFKLDLSSEEDEYIAGDTMKVALDAQYYFGVPVADAEVTYSISSQDFFFDRYTDEYFSFGAGWYYCYYCRHNDQYLLRKTVRTDENGRARIEQALDFASLFGDPDEEASKIFVVSATVQDAAGHTVSGQSSFIVHKGELYVGAKSDPSYQGVGHEVRLRAKTVDIQGEPIAKRAIELSLEKITWDTFRRREVDGGYYYHSEEVRTEVFRQTVASDRNGDAAVPFTPTDPGQYELIVKTNDSRGNVVRAKSTLYVYGEGTVSVRPTNNYTLELESEQLDVNRGDTPRIIVQSPYDHAKALIAIERGSVYEYQIVDVTGGLFEYPIPIKESYSPNIFVSVLLVSPDPEVKYGQLEFRVSPNLKRLLIGLATNKEIYLPGEEVHLSVKTTTNDNTPVPTEVSLAVADLSVLALRGNPKKDPLRYFYPGQPLTVITSSNLKHILYERDIPQGTKGGDGGNPDDLAKKKRGIFRDTAFWSAQVETNEAGEASVAFTLPDNLTTWQLEAVGVTKDTHVGVAYTELVTRKNLMAVPLRPRFVIPGDEFTIGATVFNQTDSAQTFAITLSSPTLVFLEEPRTSIRLDAGKERVVRFAVRAPVAMTRGSHAFEFAVENDDYADIVEQTIEITPNDTYEVVASAHMTKATSTREFIYVPEEVLAGKGGVSISTNATLALFATGALEYLREYPYGCSEQLSSKLGGIAIEHRAHTLFKAEISDTTPDIFFDGSYYSPEEAVRLGLERLYENQVSEGGFAYYPHLKANRELTMHILESLLRLKEAGYTVNDHVLQQATTYVRSHLLTMRFSDGSATDATQLSRAMFAYGLYVLQRADALQTTDRASLEETLGRLVADTQWLNERASPATLAYLSMITQAGGIATGAHASIYRALEQTVVLDGRGASARASSGAYRLSSLYETPIKHTALFLQALTEDKKEYPMTDAIIRWLLQSRSKDGAWGSTQNTIVAVEALTDYVAWQRETEADFELSISVGDEEVAQESFEPGMLFTQRTTVLPIDRFSRNTLETISFNRTRRSGPETNFYYDMVFKYYVPVHLLPPRDEGITITRAYFARDDASFEKPRSRATVGEVLKGRIVVTVPEEYSVVSVEDFIPAGFELVNLSLSTEDQTLLDDIDTTDVWRNRRSSAQRSFEMSIVGPFARIGNVALSFLGLGDKPKEGLAVYDARIASRTSRIRPLPVDVKEMRDDRLFLFTERLAPGEYIYEYYVRATTPGRFQQLPATASQMYFPEIFGRTDGAIVTVTEK